MENKVTINNLEELSLFAKDFLDLLVTTSQKNEAFVVALSGDLGAGKTTFVQQLAKELGIAETVNSPTFTIIKTYPAANNQSFKQLVHMDAYRIEELDELRPLRLEEVFRAGETLVCIEWAEKINAVLPKGTIYLDFKNKTGETREITITR